MWEKVIVTQINPMKTITRLFLALGLYVGGATTVIAHGVGLDTQKVEGYRIHATYDNGTPMKDAQVSVFSPKNPAQPWLRGTTNGEGDFFFRPSQAGQWQVQVRQAGHGDSVVIKVGEEKIKPTSPANTALNPPKPSFLSINNPQSPLQRGLILGSVVWGCVGTAFFFARGKQESASDAHS